MVHVFVLTNEDIVTVSSYHLQNINSENFIKVSINHSHKLMNLTSSSVQNDIFNRYLLRRFCLFLFSHNSATMALSYAMFECVSCLAHLTYGTSVLIVGFRYDRSPQLWII